MRTGGDSDYYKAFQARIRHAREEKDWTQAQMATALGITEEQYRKYESGGPSRQTPLPMHLVERFCIVTGRDVYWLVTGLANRGRPKKVASG